MGIDLARRGAVRQHSVGPHVAAGLTDRTGIVAASVPERPDPEPPARPVGWRGGRASSAVLWAGSVMLLVLTLSSGLEEQSPPAEVASAQSPRPGSAGTPLPPAPTPVPSSSPSGGPVEPAAARRDGPDEPAPQAADPATPPAAPVSDAGALAQKAEPSSREGPSSRADESPPERALSEVEPSEVASRVEDQVADSAEKLVEPVRRVVDTAFDMLPDITDQ